MNKIAVTIDTVTYEIIGGLEVKITDKSLRGNYPSGSGFGPSKPLITWSEEHNYMIPLVNRILELEEELAIHKKLGSEID